MKLTIPPILVVKWNVHVDVWLLQTLCNKTLCIKINSMHATFSCLNIKRWIQCFDIYFFNSLGLRIQYFWEMNTALLILRTKKQNTMIWYEFLINLVWEYRPKCLISQEYQNRRKLLDTNFPDFHCWGLYEFILTCKITTYCGLGVREYSLLWLWGYASFYW